MMQKLLTKTVRVVDRFFNGGTDTDDGYGMLRFVVLCALAIVVIVGSAAIISVTERAATATTTSAPCRGF